MTAYVNEHDRWYPLRSMLRSPDPEGMRAAWSTLEDVWASTIDRARLLPEEKLHESVNGEWSFVQTLRHLVFAMDKWFTVPVLGEGFHPMVLPNSGSDDLDWPGRDRARRPDASRKRSRCGPGGRSASASTSTTVTDDRSGQDRRGARERAEPRTECVYTVLEEEFEHNRYAIRDLAELE